MGIENRLSDASRRTGYSEEYSDWRDLCRDGLSAIYTLKGKLDAAEARATSAEAEVARLRDGLETAKAELDALWSFHGTNLQVYNWHLNGETAPWDGFFEENDQGAREKIDALLSQPAAAPSQPDAIRKAVEEERTAWIEVSQDVWKFGETTIRRARMLRGFMAWRLTFPDGRHFMADTFAEAKAYAEHHLARSTAAQTGEPQ